MLAFAYQSINASSQNIRTTGGEQGCLRCVHRAQATDGAAFTSGTRNNERPTQQIPTRADKKIVSFRLNWNESKSDVTLKMVHRESNLMFTLSTDRDQR